MVLEPHKLLELLSLQGPVAVPHSTLLIGSFFRNEEGLALAILPRLPMKDKQTMPKGN